MRVEPVWCNGTNHPVDSVRALFSNSHALRTERNNLVVTFIDKRTLREAVYLFDVREVESKGITDDDIRGIIDSILYADSKPGVNANGGTYQPFAGA